MNSPEVVTGLFRICTLPLEALLATGNPELCELCAELDAAETRSGELAEAAAAAITALVRGGTLARPECKDLGRIVSRLRRGAELRSRDREVVRGLLLPGDPSLAAKVQEVEEIRGRVRTLEARLREKVAAEPARAAACLWAVHRESPTAQALLASRDPAFLARCAAEGDTPDYWEGKHGRHRMAHLREIASRAAFRTIPRGWHAYVTVLSGADGAEPPRCGSGFATVWIENIHALRRRIAHRWPEGCERTRLALAPIRWNAGDKVSFCVNDLDNPARVMEVSLRLTDCLAAILETLAGRALRYPDFVAAVAPEFAAEDREILDGFVGHLIGLGVLTAARDPERVTSGWHPAGEALASRCVLRPARRDGYLDVYARCEGSFDRARAIELQDAFRRLARLSLLAETAGARPEPVETETSEQSLLEIVRARLLGTAAPPARTDGAGREPARKAALDWPLPAGDGSAYDRFARSLRPRLAAGRPIVIGDGDLDAAGAPDWRWRWPVDCMLRLPQAGASYAGVFDEAFAAGSMDARFVPDAPDLGLSMPQHDWYLRFLRAVESRIGPRFVELLFPPLSEGAANAVRRPMHVARWTGDPDWSTYYGATERAPGYVDLMELSIRTTPFGRRTVLNDRIVFAMYHATRLPIPPWDALVDVLLNAVPFQMRWSPRKLRRLLDLAPDLRFAPRLAVEGGLVVSGAQWRLSGEIAWRPSDPTWTRFRELARLRRRLDLPRLVFLSPAPGLRPTPCDLQSIYGLEAIETMSDAPDPIAVEMLPCPAETLVRGCGDRDAEHHASSTMLRFPAGIAPEAFAEQVAPDLIR